MCTDRLAPYKEKAMSEFTDKLKAELAAEEARSRENREMTIIDYVKAVITVVGILFMMAFLAYAVLWPLAKIAFYAIVYIMELASVGGHR